MIYLLRMPTNIVDRHLDLPDHLRHRHRHRAACDASTTRSTSCWRCILVVGGVIGGQFGVRAGQRLRGEQLRALLALMVLARRRSASCSISCSSRPSCYSIVPTGGGMTMRAALRLAAAAR